MLSRPKVFIGRVPGNVIPNLISIVGQHGGSIVDSIAEATHVVDWDEEVDTLPSEPTEEFVRTLEVRPSEESGKSLVHWYYHPDSYDEWIPSDHVDGSEVPDTVPQSSELNTDRQWHVCCRFIMDCEVFNEWGNEIDYESIPEGEGDDDEANDETTEKSPVKTGASRKARGRRRLEAIKARKVPILESVTVTEKMMQDVPPPLYDPALDIVTVVDILVGNECVLVPVKHVSHGGLKQSQSEPKLVEMVVEGSAEAALVVNDTGVKRKADGLEEVPSGDAKSSLSVGKQRKERTAGRKGSYQSHLKLPSWYHSEQLHALEIRHLPDLFGSEDDRVKKTAEYFKIRNYIVSLYSHNPSIYLSATDCRRKLSGDVCVVLKIHSFLDAFGVINFNTKADCRPLLSQASLSHWHENIIKKSMTPEQPLSSSRVASSASVDSLGDECEVEWSEEMDLSLRKYSVATMGDWAAVAVALKSEYNDCGGTAVWSPTAEECLTRLCSLSIPAPSLQGKYIYIYW